MHPNMILLIGNVEGDPEIIRSETGDQVAAFAFACVAFGGTRHDQPNQAVPMVVIVRDERKVPAVRQHLRKGDRVMIRGELESRAFTDKEGNTHTVWEVEIGSHGELVLLSDRDEAGQAPDGNPPESDPLA